MGTMLEALFRISFVSWFFVVAFFSYLYMKVASYDKTGNQIFIKILL